MSVGIYALRHLERGLIYIGSSRDLERRERDWIECLEFRLDGREPMYRRRMHVARLNWRFAPAARGTRAAEWSFHVLLEYPADVSDWLLSQYELGAIDWAKEEFGESCLNVSTMLRTGAWRSRPIGGENG